MKQQHTAVALGFFDGVHRGHQAVIQRVVELAEEQGLKPCAFTFSVHSRRPGGKEGSGALITEEERARVIRTMGIQEVFCPDFEEFCDLDGEAFLTELLISRYGVRALCCGGDFRFGRGARWGAWELSQMCQRHGVALAIVPAVLEGGHAVSSTRIRAHLALGEVKEAALLLGRPYGFQFPVAHGHKLGRTLEHPTINQPFPEGFALPRFGVYASFAQVEGEWRPSVTNIGVKPTVARNMAPLAETYISGTDAELYEVPVPVRLAAFMRPEERFPGMEELRAAIATDYERALRICETEAWAAH